MEKIRSVPDNLEDQQWKASPKPLVEIDPEEGLLVQRAKSGDSSALSDLFEKHLADARLAAFRICGPNNRDVIDDIVQETFLKAMKNFPSYRHERPIGFWIKSIAKNSALDYFRKNRNSQNANIDAFEFHLHANESTNPEALAETSERMRRVKSTFEHLDRREKLAIALKSSEGSYGDIAKSLDISTANARVLIHRTRKKIRDGVEDGLPRADLNPFEHPDFTLIPENSELIFKDGSTASLSRTDSQILAILMQNPNQVSRPQKIAQQLSYSTNDANKWLKGHIFNLRKALGDYQDRKQIIETLFEAGYKFNNPLAKSERLYKHQFFHFEKNARRIIVKGKTINLEPKEAFILEKLIERPNQVIPYNEFVVNGKDRKSLRVQVSNLRRKIENGRELPGVIVSDRLGYRLIA